MFKNYKLKRQILEDTAYLVGKVRHTVDSFPDIIAMANAVKDLDLNNPDVQKYILGEIVKYIKPRDKDGE